MLEQNGVHTANRCAALSAQVSAHTTAERQEMTLGVVIVPSLGLRDEVLWRGLLNEPRRLWKPVIVALLCRQPDS
jgi:hypothetical protein